MNITEIIYLIWNYIGGVILGFIIMCNEPNYLTGYTSIIVNKGLDTFYYLGVVLIVSTSIILTIRKLK